MSDGSSTSRTRNSTFNILSFTLKALYNTAQGRRFGAPWGTTMDSIIKHPERVPQIPYRPLWHPFRVRIVSLHFAYPGCAEAATLGYVVQRFQRKNLESTGKRRTAQKSVAYASGS